MADGNSMVKIQIDNVWEKNTVQQFWHIRQNEKRTKHVVQTAGS
jgi:hypothetical protein